MSREILQMIQDPADVVGLTKNLVRIPSYVESNGKSKMDERMVTDYVAQFLNEHTNLTVRRQHVQDGRYNLIAANTDSPRLMLIGHTDTVKPSAGALHDPFAAEIEDGIMYGLGATDMKSGIASILSAAALYKRNPDIMLAFYVDEEYDFAGMRALLPEMTGVKPEFILSGDGGELKTGNACRGIAEIHGVVRGRAAHAGRPEAGKNAINGTVDMFRDLNEQLQRYTHDALGQCSVNLATLQAGKAAENGEEVAITEQVNSVPDIARFKADIRIASTEVNPDVIIKIMEEFALSNGYNLQGMQTHHDLGAWYTPQDQIGDFLTIVEEVTGSREMRDPRKSGYVDLQMLWSALGEPPSATFGPGFDLHEPNEHVATEAIAKSRDVYLGTISHYDKKTR